MLLSTCSSLRPFPALLAPLNLSFINGHERKKCSHQVDRNVNLNRVLDFVVQLSLL